MCQLTFLSGDSKLSKAYLLNLTLLNAQDGNKDGHGYLVIPDKLKKSSKNGGSQVCDLSYYDALDDAINGRANINILSHVRSASRGFEINDANTHPFKMGHIVLAHNGTLEAKDDKDKIDKMIDSVWFLTKLCAIVKGQKLSPEHIAQAMKFFTGKFAFLIYDTLQPNLLFVVKGKFANLHYKYLFDGGDNEVLFFINTEKDNMENNLAPHFYKALTGNTLKEVDAKSFDDESCYIYNMSSRTLEKSKVEIKEELTVIAVGAHECGRGDIDYYRGGGQYVHSSHGGENIPSRIPGEVALQLMKYVTKLHLSLSELNALHAVVNLNSILFADTASCIELIKLLKELEPLAEKAGNKYQLWREIKETFNKKVQAGTTMEVYEEFQIQFPWFLESKGKLKRVFNSVKKWNPDRTQTSL